MKKEFRRFPFRSEMQRSDAMTRARNACDHLKKWERSNNRDPKVFSWRYADDPGRVPAYIIEKEIAE